MRKLLLISLPLLLCLMGCAVKPQPPFAHKPAAELKNVIVMSFDLCPSQKSYEKRLFKCLEMLGKREGRPVPISVAISGKWIERHPKELAEIKKMYLNITWVNHSYSHPVEHDFLNNPKVDFKYEVLCNIKAMEKYGLKPSKYFRFPGLRHNQKRLNELYDMGYIVLDADAWLGKGQKIRSGAVILIHGNGNERPGVVDRFILWLERNKEYRIVPVEELIPEAFPSGKI